jgi:hypothetical protein
MIAQATTRSLPAIARHAEQHIRQHGPTLADDAITELAPHPTDRDRVEAGIRLAVIRGRLMLDRGGTLRIPAQEPQQP